MASPSRGNIRLKANRFEWIAAATSQVTTMVNVPLFHSGDPQAPADAPLPTHRGDGRGASPAKCRAKAYGKAPALQALQAPNC